MAPGDRGWGSRRHIQEHRWENPIFWEESQNCGGWVLNEEAQSGEGADPWDPS